MDRRALVVLPTHANCEEAVDGFKAQGIDAAAYPARLTEDKNIPCYVCDGKKGNSQCRKCEGEGWRKLFQNCTNKKADAAEEMGLPVVRTICQVCSDKKNCEQSGYLHQVKFASCLDVSIATHKRAAMAGLEQIGADRKAWFIHEDPLDILRPTVTIFHNDLILADGLLDVLLKNPNWLNWFGFGPTVAKNRRKTQLYDYIFYLAELTEWLKKKWAKAQRTHAMKLPVGSKRPPGIETFLFNQTVQYDIEFVDQPWRLLLALASGDLHALGLVVAERRVKGGEKQVTKRIAGVKKNDVSTTATVWFCDATLSRKRLSMLVDVPIWDKTPNGRLMFAKRTVQFARDVTRGTAAKTVQNLLRGLLTEFHKSQRVGIICHSKHVDAIDALENEFRSRIHKTTYFGSGEDRSSNSWHESCDLLVVLGTPRVPPDSLSEHLIKLGQFDAAGKNPKWALRRWQGTTESGKTRIVKALGYNDDDWHQAHQDKVRAAIIQAVGRGRSTLPTGCEVVLVSTEECGLPLSDTDIQTISKAEAAITRAVRELSLQNPNNNILGKGSVKTAQVADSTNLAKSHARNLLAKLAERGFVEKVGDRSGWRLTDRTHPPEQQESKTDESPASLNNKLDISEEYENYDEVHEYEDNAEYEDLWRYDIDEWDEDLRVQALEAISDQFNY